MDVAALLTELYGRIPPLVRGVVDGIEPDHLTERPSDKVNTVGWLLWHLIRVQDHHVAELLGTEQIWVHDEWAAGFGLEPDPTNTGYGHGAEEVVSVRPVDAAAVTGYLDAVTERTGAMLADLTRDELDRVVDDSWDPPVTLGVRLVSIADDSLQHVGQAAYLRGLLGA